MSNPNENALQGMQCPECGHYEDFRITITTVAIVSDEGVESMGDKDWDDTSACSCQACNFMANVLAFCKEIAEPDDE